jgi:hypothetical protein
MAVLTGKSGSITHSAGYTTKITGWSVRIDAAQFDNTALGSKWRNNITGRHNVTGTYTCGLDSANITATNGASDATLAELNIGDSAADAQFIFDSTGGKIQLDIITTGADFTCDRDGKNEVTFTWVAGGPPTTAG